MRQHPCNHSARRCASPGKLCGCLGEKQRSWRRRNLRGYIDWSRPAALPVPFDIWGDISVCGCRRSQHGWQLGAARRWQHILHVYCSTLNGYFNAVGDFIEQYRAKWKACRRSVTVEPASFRSDTLPLPQRRQHCEPHSLLSQAGYGSLIGFPPSLLVLKRRQVSVLPGGSLSAE